MWSIKYSNGLVLVWNFGNRIYKFLNIYFSIQITIISSSHIRCCYFNLYIKNSEFAVLNYSRSIKFVHIGIEYCFEYDKT